MNRDIDISNILKERRHSAGLSQIEAARISKISRPSIGAYEEGRAIPRLNVLVKLANAYGFDSLDRFLNVRKAKGERSKIEEAYFKLQASEKKIVDFIMKLK